MALSAGQYVELQLTPLVPDEWTAQTPFPKTSGPLAQLAKGCNTESPMENLSFTSSHVGSDADRFVVGTISTICFL